MAIQHVILGLGWVLYVALHSILAATQVKNVIINKSGISQPLYRVGYNVIAVVLLILLLMFQLRMQQQKILQVNSVLVAFSIGLVTAGLAIMSTCIYRYFRQMSGLNNGRLELVTDGLHQYIRHPLYLGTFLFLIGLFLGYPLLSVLVVITIIILYTLIALRWEEKKLMNAFGENYARYRHKVPAIIPRIFTFRSKK